MRKILEIEIPLLRCYPHHGLMFATVMANDYDFDEVAFNYIQLVYNKNNNRLDFNHGLEILNYIENIPYSDKYCYDRHVIDKKWDNYATFVKDMIDEDCYVYMLVDVYYISAYANWYQKIHMEHDMTIYGYENGYFYVADCFVNGIYGFAKITYEELLNAIMSKDKYDWLYGVHCIKKREDMYIGMQIDAKMVKKFLNLYLVGKEAYALTAIEKQRRAGIGKKFIYGINIYDSMLKYVEDEEINLDVRYPYILVEHKKVLLYICNKLKYQYKLKDADENLRMIEELYQKNIALQNLFLLYNYDGSHKNKIRIKNCITEAKKREQEVLKKICRDIQNKSMFEKPVCNFNNSSNIKYVCDWETQGNWKGVYGKKGYYLIGDKNEIPKNVEIYVNNCIYVSVLRNNADKRALLRAKNAYRPVAYYLFNKEFNIEIRTNNYINISLYMVDYDKLGRKQKVYVQNKNNGNLLFQYDLMNFESGYYISFEVDSDVIITIERMDGPDAVLSGIFFD